MTNRLARWLWTPWLVSALVLFAALGARGIAEEADGFSGLDFSELRDWGEVEEALCATARASEVQARFGSKARDRVYKVSRAPRGSVLRTAEVEIGDRGVKFNRVTVTLNALHRALREFGRERVSASTRHWLVLKIAPDFPVREVAWLLDKTVGEGVGLCVEDVSPLQLVGGVAGQAENEVRRVLQHGLEPKKEIDWDDPFGDIEFVPKK